MDEATLTGLRILIADDDPIVCAELPNQLRRIEGVDKVFAATSGSQAIYLADLHHIDVALLDVAMPGVDGIDATKTILKRHPKIKIVMLTNFVQQTALGQALQAGASGFLTKDQHPQLIVDSLREVLAGKTVMGAKPTEVLANFYRRTQAHLENDTAFRACVAGLPGHERAAFDGLALALPNRLIAKRMGVTENTVKGYVASILNKTGCPSRTGLVLKAARNGLTPND